MARHLRFYRLELGLWRILGLDVVVRKDGTRAVFVVQQETAESQPTSTLLLFDPSELPSALCELLHELIGSGTPALDGA